MSHGLPYLTDLGADRERDCRDSIHLTYSPATPTESLSLASIIAEVDCASSLYTFGSSEDYAISSCCEQFLPEEYCQNCRSGDIRVGTPLVSEATANMEKHRSFLILRSSRKTNKCFTIVPVLDNEKRPHIERTDSRPTRFAKFGGSANWKTGREPDRRSIVKRLIAHIRKHS
uniref:Uncharacterized protein n=1 Tax=Moniliophthora roreri TaxID=221103 RepID=A0A0W0FYL0_MONRR